MLTLPDPIDVLIVGSGHAGIEAALASARLGCRTLMLTQNLDTIGQMSCNPAIGGSGKSHIVKEIDALGGAMGINADATGIQFRVLNRSKGEAVWATRVQCDKKAYQFRMKATLEKTPNLQLLQGTAATLLVEGDRAVGVTTDLGMIDPSESGSDHSRHIPAWVVARRRAVEARGTDGGCIFEPERQYSCFGIRSRPLQDRDSMPVECEFDRFRLVRGAGRGRATTASFVPGEGSRGEGRIVHLEF